MHVSDSSWILLTFVQACTWQLTLSVFICLFRLRPYLSVFDICVQAKLMLMCVEHIEECSYVYLTNVFECVHSYNWHRFVHVCIWHYRHSLSLHVSLFSCVNVCVYLVSSCLWFVYSFCICLSLISPYLWLCSCVCLISQSLCVHVQTSDLSISGLVRVCLYLTIRVSVFLFVCVSHLRVCGCVQVCRCLSAASRWWPSPWSATSPSADLCTRGPGRRCRTPTSPSPCAGFWLPSSWHPWPSSRSICACPTMRMRVARRGLSLSRSEPTPCCWTSSSSWLRSSSCPWPTSASSTLSSTMSAPPAATSGCPGPTVRRVGVHSVCRLLTCLVLQFSVHFIHLFADLWIFVAPLLHCRGEASKTSDRFRRLAGGDRTRVCTTKRQRRERERCFVW